MIYILHGDDTFASYTQLQEVLKRYPDFQKTRLSAGENSQEDFYLSVFTRDILDEKKVIILENFLLSKKVKPKQIEKIPQDIPVIFWEKSKITLPSLTKKISAYINEFKPAPTLFYFLDSIAKGASAKSVEYLNNLDNKTGLIWHLTTRILLLILIKLGITLDLAATIISRPLALWQWQKLIYQAKSLSLPSLFKIYNGLLKLDFMMKTAGTNLDEDTLISLLLIKYLT